jgi:hypothetical protein
MVVEKLSSALMFGAVRGAAQIVQKLEAARPLSAMAMDMVMRRIGRASPCTASDRASAIGRATRHTSRASSPKLHSHMSSATRPQAYRRSDALEKRRALMEAWAQWCEPREAADNVTPLRRKG